MTATFTPAKTMPPRPTAPGETGHVATHQGLHDALGEVRDALTSMADAINQDIGDKADKSHTHPASSISDATAVGKQVLTAADAATARNAIGAGTSNLAVGATASTAKAGDYQPAWNDVTGKPSTFAPAAHGHSTADVTGLDAALAAVVRTVTFGTTASTARPAGVPNGGVYWVGSGAVLPANALPADQVFLP
jgi:hypothetical protein